LSKIEAGKLSLSYEPFSLASLVSDMLNIFQVKCDEKGISLESEVDPSLPAMIVLDEARIRQIIFNLIGNAVKFTREGKVELRVHHRAIPLSPHKADIRIEVADTGVGIKAEDRENIFKPFEQSKGQKEKEYGGTGLGLSITSRLVKMMNGNLSLSSESGRGSSFVVDLPEVSTLQSDSSAKNHDEDQHPSAESYPGKDILVVDDNPLNRRVISASLNGLGVSIREAVDGYQCLEMIEEKRPDLIFMDIMMPDLAGGEVSRRIREDDRFSNLPVIACTALDVARASKISEKARFDDILVKPISQVVLRRTLSRFLGDSVVKENNDASTDRLEEGASRSTTPAEVTSMAQVDVVLAKVEAEVIPVWESLRRRSQIQPILSVAEKLGKWGEAYQIQELVEYARELEQCAATFNISLVREKMLRFDSVVGEVREKYLEKNTAD